MRTRKNILKYSLIGILTLVLCVGGGFGTYAWLTDWGQMNNQFVVGRNDIGITESFKPPKEMGSGDTIFAKEVQVSNTGTVDCYVRVFADFSDSEVKEQAYLSGEKLNTAEDARWVKATDYRNNLPENWVYVSLGEESIGGYFYYTKPLAPNEDTTYLIRSVRVDFENAEKVKDFEIIISVESVQSLDSNGQPYDSWKDCWVDFIEGR